MERASPGPLISRENEDPHASFARLKEDYAMIDQDNLKSQRHVRCRQCGYRSALGTAVCGNPSCGADLGIYGEVVEPAAKEPTPPHRSSKEEEHAQRQEEELHQAADTNRETKQAGGVEKAQKRKPHGLWRILGPTLFLLGVLALFALFRDNLPATVLPENPDDIWDSGEETEQGEGPEAGAEKPWAGNVLMEDVCQVSDTEEAYALSALGMDLAREEIGTVTFLDTLEDVPEDAYDVSMNRDGSVLAWQSYDRDTGYYDLFIGGKGGVSAAPVLSDLFRGYCNVTSIDFNGAFHTENAIQMDRMFNDCRALAELDVSGFNTSNVTDMYCMFYQCDRLTRLDVSGFDTSNVTDMGYMFWNCGKLTELDVSGFDTSYVTSMVSMFAGCSALTELNVSGFDTSYVTDMRSMFYGCSGLAELDVSGWDTAQVTDMYAMFYGCENLSGLDISGWDTAQVANWEYMLSGLPDYFALTYNPNTFDPAGAGFEE